ncbi:hypothetical protein UB48_24760 [Pseudomonas sp. 2(2015)]|nr:hypothetical protein UB48_24760 [Pseudomonas sp. 2(2015)]
MSPADLLESPWLILRPAPDVWGWTGIGSSAIGAVVLRSPAGKVMKFGIRLAADGLLGWVNRGRLTLCQIDIYVITSTVHWIQVLEV